MICFKDSINACLKVLSRFSCDCVRCTSRVCDGVVTGGNLMPIGEYWSSRPRVGKKLGSFAKTS